MTPTEAARAPTMNGPTGATQFLTELWGSKPPGFITTWELARKSTYYWSYPCVGEHHYAQPDVFFGVSTTARNLGRKHRPRSDQVCALAGLYLDIDEDRPLDKLAATNYLTVEPTIIVDSGHGLHAYFLFDCGPWVFTSTAERDQAAYLLEAFNRMHPAADQSVHDLARVMRLPGTVNNKDPHDPRPVRVLTCDGPRHKIADLLDLSGEYRARADTAKRATAGVGSLTGDTSMFVRKLDALLDLSPEFAARWTHTSPPPDGSMSAYDMSLCTLAAGAMTNAELAKLIDMHRCQWGDANDIMKGHRESYLRETIGKARAAAEHAAAMRELEG